jgi:hypothetical protein
MQNFWDALKPGGVLYLTVVLAGAEDLKGAYERGKRQGLPVVFGELADKLEETFDQSLAQPAEEAEEADEAAYHFCPPLEQVRSWIRGAGLEIEEEGVGNWYAHFLVRKNDRKT